MLRYLPCILLVGLVFGLGAIAAVPLHRPIDPVLGGVPVADDEVEISFAEVPDAVRASAVKSLPEKSVTKVIRETDDGLTLYVIEYQENGAQFSTTFASSGDILETERVVAEARLPAAAREAILKKFPGAAISEVRAVTVTYYDVAFASGGKTLEMEVNAAGQSGDDEDEDEDEDDEDEDEYDDEDEDEDEGEDDDDDEEGEDDDR